MLTQDFAVIAPATKSNPLSNCTRRSRTPILPGRGLHSRKYGTLAHHCRERRERVGVAKSVGVWLRRPHPKALSSILEETRSHNGGRRLTARRARAVKRREGAGPCTTSSCPYRAHTPESTPSSPHELGGREGGREGGGEGETVWSHDIDHDDVVKGEP